MAASSNPSDPPPPCGALDPADTNGPSSAPPASLQLVNNRLLALRCARLGLGRFLRCLPFRIGKQQGRRLLWAAPGGASGGAEGEAAPCWEHEAEEVEAAEEPGMVRLPLKLKALGDVVEALLGAFWCHGGAPAAREALALLGIAVPAADSSGRPWRQSTEEEGEAEGEGEGEAAAAAAGASMPPGKEEEEEEDRGQEDGEGEGDLVSALLQGLVGFGMAEEPGRRQRDAVAEKEALGSAKEHQPDEKQTSPEGGEAAAPEFVLGALALGRADEARMRRASAAMGFEFRSPGLVREALTHCSMLLEPSYQRLEFLGDAVLEFAVTCALYALPGGLGPGAMTSRRSAVVCNDALARRCVELGLHSCIRHLSGPLVHNISDTVRQIDTLRQQQQQDEGSSGHSGRSGGGFAPEGPPIHNRPLSKCCADVLESLIGAVFVESSSSSSSAEGGSGSGAGAVLPEHRQLEVQQPPPSSLVSAAPSYRMLGARDAGIEAAAKVLLGGVVHVEP